VQEVSGLPMRRRWIVCPSMMYTSEERRCEGDGGQNLFSDEGSCSSALVHATGEIAACRGRLSHDG
jgi:hypothetical protein